MSEKNDEGQKLQEEIEALKESVQNVKNGLEEQKQQALSGDARRKMEADLASLQDDLNQLRAQVAAADQERITTMATIQVVKEKAEKGIAQGDENTSKIMDLEIRLENFGKDPEESEKMKRLLKEQKMREEELARQEQEKYIDLMHRMSQVEKDVTSVQNELRIESKRLEEQHQVLKQATKSSIENVEQQAIKNKTEVMVHVDEKISELEERIRKAGDGASSEAVKELQDRLYALEDSMNQRLQAMEAIAAEEAKKQLGDLSNMMKNATGNPAVFEAIQRALSQIEKQMEAKADRSMVMQTDQKVMELAAALNGLRTSMKDLENNLASQIEEARHARAGPNAQTTVRMDNLEKEISALHAKLADLLAKIDENSDSLSTLQDFKTSFSEKVLSMSNALEKLQESGTPNPAPSSSDVSASDLKALRNDIKTLFETKVDIGMMQRALAEKGDAKVLASKVSKAYVDQLFEELSKNVAVLRGRMDTLTGQTIVEWETKILNVKKMVLGKADKADLNNLVSRVDEIATMQQDIPIRDESIEGTVSRKQLVPGVCLACDRPLPRLRTEASSPQIPYLPPVSGLNFATQRGGYEVEFHRNARKGESRAQRVTSAFRRAMEGGDDDLEVTEVGTPKLPPLHHPDSPRGPFAK
jgi:chromosome segregation ATPase